MMWVNETLPPRARLRWLLMTMRLSQSNFTGMLRTEVAVGTASEMSMFLAVAAAMPRRTVSLGSSVGWAGSVGFDSRGSGLAVPLAGSTGLLTGRGLATGAGADAAGAAGAAGAAAGLLAAGAAGAADAEVADGLAAAAFVAAPLEPPFSLK